MYVNLKLWPIDMNVAVKHTLRARSFNASSSDGRLNADHHHHESLLHKQTIVVKRLHIVPAHDGSTAGYSYGTTVYTGLDSSVRHLSIPSDSSSAH